MVQADDLADFLYVLQRKCLLDRATALNGYSLYPTKVDLRHREASRSGRALWLVVDRHCWGRGRRSPDERAPVRSEEHTSELQSLMRISYAVFCLKKTKPTQKHTHNHQ